VNLLQGLPPSLSKAHALIRQQHAYLNEQSHQLNEQSTVIEDQASEIIYLKEQLKLAKIKLFARSSERFVDPDDPQYQLFDEMPVVDTDVNDEDNEETEVSGHKRKRNRGKRASLPDILERDRVEHTLPESALIGPNGEQYEKIGEVVSEQLEIVPAQVRVTTHVRAKYAVKGREELGVLIAPVANQPIPKSIASASMLAHIAQSKYEYHWQIEVLSA
jgi:transposase